MFRRFNEFVFVVGFTAAFVDAPAHAYLDGGTISLFLQGVTGCVAAVLLFGRAYLTRFKNLFRRSSNRASRDDSQG